jgi:hypothetical protein
MKVDDREDSTFNNEETKMRALESDPQVPRGQIPNGEEVTKAENKKEANKHIRKRGYTF